MGGELSYLGTKEGCDWEYFLRLGEGKMQENTQKLVLREKKFATQIYIFLIVCVCIYTSVYIYTQILREVVFEYETTIGFG